MDYFHFGTQCFIRTMSHFRGIVEDSYIMVYFFDYASEIITQPGIFLVTFTVIIQGSFEDNSLVGYHDLFQIVRQPDSSGYLHGHSIILRLAVVIKLIG